MWSLKQKLFKKVFLYNIHGKNGRGCEEVCKGTSDLLVSTLGKGFGTDGGYVTGDKVLIDYLRESASTYIYSNSLSPPTSGAALAAIKIVDSPKGKALIKTLNENIVYFKERMQKKGFRFATDSMHAIQPLLIGDPHKAHHITSELFKERMLVTNLSYPIVQKGRDEIRVQLSAAHTHKDIDNFVNKIFSIRKKMDIL